MKLSLIFSLMVFCFYICLAQNIPYIKFNVNEDHTRWIKTPKGLKIYYLDKCEYETDGKIEVVLYDLNADGKPEYFIKYYETKFLECGYAIVDGKTLCQIGDVGGKDVYVSERRKHGFYSIITISRASIDFELYEYNGEYYQKTKSIHNDSGIDSLSCLIDSIMKSK